MKRRGTGRGPGRARDGAKAGPGEGIDVLAEVLGTFRLKSRLFCRSELSAPWAMTMKPAGFAHFHVIERGGAWIRLEGRRQAVALSGGDLVVVPHGRGHTLSHAPVARAVPLERLLGKRVPEENSACHVVRHGGGGAETRMICGAFEFGDAGSSRSRSNPILESLPPLIHVRAEDGASGEWLDAILKLLASESSQPRPGTAAIITRLTDILFVKAIRVWLESEPPGAGGWLGALSDPQIGRAIARIHASPGEAWNVSSLASEAAMSRSPFAARFTALVGEPPLTYLTRWRMQTASNGLRAGAVRLSDLAQRVGYESEAAFSKAFKRHFGLSPRAFRTARVEGEGDLAPIRATR
jgi:AraC-like DNA-binding protein